MTTFEERWGNLTVGEALELNKAARQTCELEMTAEIGRDDISYLYMDPEVTKAFEEMDKEENEK